MCTGPLVSADISSATYRTWQHNDAISRFLLMVVGKHWRIAVMNTGLKWIFFFGILTFEYCTVQTCYLGVTKTMRNTTASVLSHYAQFLSRLKHQHKTFENTIVRLQKSPPLPWRVRHRDRKCSKTAAQNTNILHTLNPAHALIL